MNASAADRAALLSDLRGSLGRGTALRKIVDGVYVESEAKQVFS